MCRNPICTLIFLLLFAGTDCRVLSQDWPGWRGPLQNGISGEQNVPVEWSNNSNIRWQCAIAGEGSSSPIVWENTVFVSAASLGGEHRWLYDLDRTTGVVRWKRELLDNNPEFTSPLTGHAAATPVTDGQSVYAWFGNAGMVCYDFAGIQKWHRKIAEFETELGLATSPVIHGDLIYVVCDHDGDRFRTFDSFLVALDKHTGEERWRAERPGLFRSWSTPLVRAEHNELVVAGDKQLRAYDLAKGHELWHVDGLLEWVAPSPVAREDLVIAMCGRNGPILAVQDGEIKASRERMIWQHDTGGSYVCSPLIYEDYLYVHDEQGILVCYEVRTGNQVYQQRLEGTCYSSAVAAEGRIYITSEQGTTFVIRAGREFEVLAKNVLEEQVLGTPAVSRGNIFLRASQRLYCIGKQ